MKADAAQAARERGDQLDILADKIPGGIFRCLYDQALTILEMSDGFPAMFGYTVQEIHTLLGDSFKQMIFPADRETSLEQVQKQLAQGVHFKELEYRVLCKDGTAIWVLDKGRITVEEDGTPSFCCILVDITHNKEIQEQLRLSLERFQIILDQANDIIFEWDIQADTFSFSPNWRNKFSCIPLEQHVTSCIAESANIFPEDRALMAALLYAIRGGEHYVEAELRLRTEGSKYIWCRFRVTGQHDDAGRPIKAVGVIIDIDSEKQRAQSLEESAQKDALTKLYNKGAIQRLIEEHLATRTSGACCALLILDIDDFKLINDTKGHLFGDAFLIEIAREIQKQFRSIDIVGRVGGDEFIIYMKNIPGEMLAMRKADQLVRAFSRAGMHDKLGCDVSCSVGIAMAPQHGTSYSALFLCADHALYQAKGTGKNRCVLYDAATMDESFSGIPRRVLSAVSDRIESDESTGSLHGKLVEYVFRILYKSINMETAVNAILEIVGKHFDVSRAYIFENTPDDLHCSNTFEWCNTGVLPERDSLRHVSYEQDLGGGYLRNFDEEGIFYCRDITVLATKQREILEPQGIKSLLQCAIRDNGAFKGYVGFDECRINRFWTKEQVETLTFISEILSTFLLKQRAQDTALRTAQAMRNILDGQNAWIYVVRPDNYEMLYINRKTLDLVPTAQIGMKCHKAYFNLDEPCPVCPARDAIRTGEGCTLEVYNPVLDVWSCADASFIDWMGEKAVMLCCHDITPYKRIDPLL